MLLGCLSLYAADNDLITKQITINLEKAGTLPDRIASSEKYKITNLKIIGEINGTDLNMIREMAGGNYTGNSTDGKLSVSRITSIITSSHLTNHIQIRTIYLTNNLQIGNLILFTTCNSIRQSTSLFQINGDLLCNQVVICSIKRQTTKQHKHQGKKNSIIIQSSFWLASTCFLLPYMHSRQKG